MVLPGTAGATPTATPTATALPPTATRTAVATATATRTPINTVTVTATASRTGTATATATAPPLFQLAGRIRTADGLPVAGVSVGLPPTGQSGATDANGNYSFGAAPGIALQLAPRRNGGAGGAISALDAAWVLQAIAGSRTLTRWQRLAGDITGDGTLSTLDAVLMLQRAVGNTAPFPAATACSSAWLFVPAPTAAPNQSPIQPALTTGACQPGAVAFNPLSANATGQDFTAVLLGDCTGNWSP